PGCLHHLVGHPAKEGGVGLRDVLGRVSMQVFVDNPFTMIAAAAQCGVERIPKGSHHVTVPLRSGVAIAIVSFMSRLLSGWCGCRSVGRESKGRTAAPGTSLAASHYTRRSSCRRPNCHSEPEGRGPGGTGVVARNLTDR